MRVAFEASRAIVLLALFSWHAQAQISSAQIDAAFRAAESRVNNCQAEEEAAIRAGYTVQGLSASARHQYGTHGETPASFNQPAFLFPAATLDLVNKNLVSKSNTGDLAELSFQANTQARRAQTQCLNTVNEISAACRDVNRYTFDGSCNNLRNPTLGRTNTCHRRLLPPSYEDGVEAPRSRSFAGGVLPNERDISLTALHYILPRVQDDPKFNHNRMSFGQFIAHDVSLTPTTTIGTSNALPDCCNPSTQIAQCYPISIPPNDRYYGNLRCMNFVRSQPCARCQLGPREQMDAVTSFVDLSHIYGLTDQQSRNLRSGSNGLLRGQFPHNRMPYLPLLMPPSTQTDDDGCSQSGRSCFTGGDPLRVNQQIGISAWSTLWFRYHNDLADRISQYALSRRERWSDERIFQTARRIAQAHLQLQVYREWLPTVVGSNILSFYGLEIRDSQTTYDPSVNPSLWSEFAGGAFRFGHSMIQNVFRNRDYMRDVPRPDFDVPTKDAFSTIPNYYNTNSGFIAENFIAGMYRQKAKQISFSFAPGVTNDVYRNSSQSFGMDLPALNIHRGRDHGLQPYYRYAELYLSHAYGRTIRIQSFNDIRNYWRRDCFDELPRVYRDIRDVDLYVGGLCEISPISGSVGPTMGTIIAMQFQQLRYGDRLFVSHRNVFSPAQYAELMRTGWLYWVVCSAGLDQPAAYVNAFRHDDQTFAYCNSLRPLDVSLFADVAQDL